MPLGKEGRIPWPKPHSVRWGPSSPQTGTAAPPTFGPCLLWPNGLMDQDAIWYRGRPRHRPHCVRWVPSSSPKGHRSPQFSAHVYCGQTAGWIKMPLVTEVGLGPGDIVLDGDPAPPPPPKGAQQIPTFRPCLLWSNGHPSQLLLSSC